MSNIYTPINSMKKYTLNGSENQALPKKRSKGVWIPREIAKSGSLSLGEKFVWAFLNPFCEAKYKLAFERQKVVARKLGMLRRQLQRCISSLLKKGLLVRGTCVLDDGTVKKGYRTIHPVQRDIVREDESLIRELEKGVWKMPQNDPITRRRRDAEKASGRRQESVLGTSAGRPEDAPPNPLYKKSLTERSLVESDDSYLKNGRTSPVSRPNFDQLGERFFEDDPVEPVLASRRNGDGQEFEDLDF